MVTNDIGFRISNAGDKSINTSWTKATVELRGPVLTLSWGFDERLSFPIGRGTFSDLVKKKKNHFDIIFADKCLSLTFPVESDAIAWMALIHEGALGVSSETRGGDREQRKVWVKEDSGVFRPARESDINVTLWIVQWVWVPLRDFAGQIVYYATHSWHVARRSLLVLAVDLRNAHGEETKQRMCWWLRMIRKWSRNASGRVESCVVLVGTHKDKICPKTSATQEQKLKLKQAQQALITAIREAFDCDPGDVVAGGQVFSASSCTLDGIDMLAEKLQDLLTDPNGIMQVGTIIPESYFQLAAIVDELAKTKPFITRDKLREECSLCHAAAVESKTNDVSGAVEANPFLFQDDASFDAAILYLHHTGAALCFEQAAHPAAMVHPFFKYVFIQPQWLTKLFSMIELQKHKGKCTLDSSSPEGYRMLIRQGLLRLDLLRELWKHDEKQRDPSRTLSKLDDKYLRQIELNDLVALLCHFDVLREVPWSDPSLVPARAEDEDAQSSRRLVPSRDATSSVSHAAASNVSERLLSSHTLLHTPASSDSKPVMHCDDPVSPRETTSLVSHAAAIPCAFTPRLPSL